MPINAKKEVRQHLQYTIRFLSVQMDSNTQTQILSTAQASSVLDSDFVNAPKTVRETIKWLIEVLMRPPMPECPVECERDCDVPQGKAPAYLNGDGKAHLVKWKPYQEIMPDRNEIRAWFSKTKGIGTLGGWNGRHYIGFVDLDHKADVFESYEAFLATYENWMDSYPILKSAPRFKTPSGGYRVILAFTESQDWVAFTLIEGMPRMGELLQKSGSHTLLPPSLSIEGKPYQWEHFTEYPPIVSNPQEVGIYPTRKNHSNADNDRPLRQTSSYVPGALRLEDLGNDKALAVLNGENITGDRSESLTVAAREWYGWENFCRKNGLVYNGTTEELTAYAWSRLDDGKDPGKWQRILKTVDPDSHAAAEHVGGEESCWKKIKRLDVRQYQSKCPDVVRQSIEPGYGKNADAVKSEFQVDGSDRPKTFKESQESEESQQSGYAKFRQEIADWNALQDPIEKDFKLRQTANKYKMPMNVVNRILFELTRTRDAQASDDELTLEDFANMSEVGTRWIIPRFMPDVGLSMLAGFAKDGKSKLMYHMTRSLIKGEPFLGETPRRQCRVLMIQCEERKGSILQNLDGVSLLDDPEVISSGLLKVRRSWQIDDLDTLERWIREHKADVVLIDSLRKISSHLGVSENAQEFANPMYDLQERVHRLGVACMVIHHTNKSTEAKGLAKIAGNSALAGTCDNILMLMRCAEGDSAKRHLVMEGRDCNGKFLIEFVTDEFPRFRWDFHMEIGRDPDSQKIKDRIIKAIRLNQPKNPEGITVSFIRQALEMSSDDRSLYRPLQELVDDQILTSRRATKDRRIRLYSLPDWEKEPSFTANNDNTSQTLTESVLTNSQTIHTAPGSVNSFVEDDEDVITTDGNNSQKNEDCELFANSCNEDVVKVSDPYLSNGEDYSQGSLSPQPYKSPVEYVGGNAVYRKDAPPRFRKRHNITENRYAPDGTDRFEEIKKQAGGVDYKLEDLPQGDF